MATYVVVDQRSTGLNISLCYYVCVNTSVGIRMQVQQDFRLD